MFDILLFSQLIIYESKIIVKHFFAAIRIYQIVSGVVLQHYMLFV